MMGLRRMWRAEGNFQSVLSTTRSWNQKQCPPWQQVLYLPYPYAISPLPSPVLLAFDFETGSDFFRLVLNLLGLGFWLSFPQYQRLWASFIRPMFTVLYFYSELLGGGGVSSAKVHIWRSFCSATLFHLWKTADAWSTTILTALLSNLKRASDSWVPGWQVYTATHGCSSCTTPLEFRQSSFQQR